MPRRIIAFLVKMYLLIPQYFFPFFRKSFIPSFFSPLNLSSFPYPDTRLFPYLLLYHPENQIDKNFA